MGWSRMATSARPRRQWQPRGRIGLDNDHAHGAARPMLNALVLEDLGHGHPQRKRSKRQIQPLQSQRRQAKQEARHQADHARHRDGGPIGHAKLIHQHRSGVGPYGIKGAMAQRNLAVVAGEHVQAQQCNGIGQRQCELENTVVTQQKGQRTSHHQQDSQANNLPPAERRARGRCAGGRSGC
jgi:hypothetical protein